MSVDTPLPLPPETSVSFKDASQWPYAGIDGPWLEAKGAWLKEERNLHGNSCKFFVTAGSLFIFARYEYAFGSVAFFQAILGLEAALKLHYGVDTGFLKELLESAINDGVISDATLGEVQPFTDNFSRQVEEIIGKEAMSRCAQLVILLPRLRNQYFHGTYLLAPDYCHLTLQLRLMADALTTRHPFGIRPKE